MSAFHDDHNADMADPAYAAEFERATAEIRRERYHDAMVAAEHRAGSTLLLYKVHAAMALADEEIQAAKMEATQIVTRRWSEESVRTNRLIQDLRSDLRESADALEESAQLLEDALNEGERLRTELREVKKVADRRESWLSTLRAELETLYDGNRRALNTISRVRAVLGVIDSRGWTHPHSIMERLRSALDGESE